MSAVGSLRVLTTRQRADFAKCSEGTRSPATGPLSEGKPAWGTGAVERKSEPPALIPGAGGFARTGAVLPPAFGRDRLG